MSFFITVIICDLTYVFLPPATNLCLVDFGDRIGRILFVLMLFPLLVLLGLVGRLGILGKSGHRSFSLGFVLAMFFYCFLRLNLVCSDVGRRASSKDLLISFLYVKTWL